MTREYFGLTDKAVSADTPYKNYTKHILGTTSKNGCRRSVGQGVGEGEMMLDGARPSILIVDDDAQNLAAMQELLQDLGHRLVPVDSGEEALRRVLKDDFAVILLDVRMPGIDGYTAAKMIRDRERSRHTPIIFLTGAHDDLDSVFRGYRAGAVDYMIKPVIPNVLKSKISVFVELYNKTEALTREIEERKQVETQLRESEEMLRNLALHLQSVREEEQTRIAREIHDELGQFLTGLKMDLTWLAEKLPPDQKPLMKKAESMFGLIDDTVHLVRKIASGLRPEVLDEAGLAAAIGWQAREFQMRTGIRCKVTLPPDNGELDPERSTAVFRIFQEVLTNVARHAKATRVDVLMRVNGATLELEVRDNGKGISESDVHSPKSLGLVGMRERVYLIGGKIGITGQEGKGTRVTVSAPLR